MREGGREGNHQAEVVSEAYPRRPKCRGNNEEGGKEGGGGGGHLRG